MQKQSRTYFLSFIILKLYSEKWHKSKDENYQHNYGKHVFHISVHPALYFKTLTLISLFGKVIKAPADFFISAVDNEGKRAEGKQKIAYKEVLPIQNLLTKRGEAR